jgi:undecaprenyl-diphosphatase
MALLTYPEAIVIGALQGVAELFPVSSLGHSIIVPALVGGRWARDLNVSAAGSPYLAFVVGLHVATALALLVYFWRDWVRIIGGLVTSVRYRRIGTAEERLAWMIVLATIPVGIAGLLLDHPFRTLLGRPVPAAVFLMLNGGLLLAAERLRRRAAERARRPVEVAAAPGVYRSQTAGGGETDSPAASDRRLAAGTYGGAVAIGAAQILALLPGISRSGATMAAGVLKLPDLAGPAGAGIHGQVLAGSLASGVGAYLSVRFLTRYFETRTLIPFAVYCLVAGFLSLLWLTLR